MNMFVLRDDQEKIDDSAAPAPRLFAVESEIQEDAAPSAPASGPAPATKQPGRLRNLAALPLFAAAFPVRFGGSGAAFECPRYIADTEALVNRVADQLERQSHRMDEQAAGLVRDLLDDAQMLLKLARENHENPRSAYDHARAYAKVEVAQGHARAAEIIQSRCSQGR